MNDSALNEIDALGSDLNVQDLREVQAYNDYLQRLEHADMSAISAMFNAIADPQNATEIAEWIAAADLEQSQATRYRNIWYFLLLVEILEERGIAPFSSGALSRFGPSETLNWFELPLEFHYLVEPASKYGNIQFGDQIDVFNALKSVVEARQLLAIAERANGDMSEIVDWMRQVDEANRESKQSSPVADRIDFFLILLRELGYY